MLIKGVLIMSSIESQSNAKKSRAGKFFDDIVYQRLVQFKEAGIISDFQAPVHVAHQDYKYGKQYLANFVIRTLDDKYIIVRNTTSFRSDRAKIAFYDLLGIRKYSKYADLIIASILLLPDSASGDRSLEIEKQRVRNKESFSPVTHYFYLSEFLEFLDTYGNDLTTQKEHDATGVTMVSFGGMNTIKEDGSFFGRRGNQFEADICNLLNNLSQLDLYKSNSLACNSIYAMILNRILHDSGEDSRSDLLKVNAISTVPLLKNGGKPKTDIVITIFIGLKRIQSTLSLKFTNSNRVTCHDYPAEKFIEVLDCKNSRLAEYLRLFQDNPSAKGLGESLPQGYSATEFARLMSTYERKITEWALSGEHDNEDLNDPDLQIAKYCLIHKEGQTVLHSMEEYAEKLIQSSQKTFGIPFGWTYPSKQRGKRIQLKMPVLMG